MAEDVIDLWVPSLPNSMTCRRFLRHPSQCVSEELYSSRVMLLLLDVESIVVVVVVGYCWCLNSPSETKTKSIK